MSTFKDIIIRKLNVPNEAFLRAEEAAKKNGNLIVHELIRMQAADPKTLLSAYAHSYKLKVADLDAMDIPPNIISLIPQNVAKGSRTIPLDRVGNNIIIAMENPHDVAKLGVIQTKTGFSVKPVLASEEQIGRALQKYYSSPSMPGTSPAAPSPISAPKLGGGNKNAGQKTKDLNAWSQQQAANLKKPNKVVNEKRSSIGDSNEGGGPAVQLVDQILMECVNQGASDIHIEPYESFIRVRLRIDGSLVEIARPPVEFVAPMTSRFKIMSGLNIAEKRLPQDGNISVTIQNRPIDFRVNTLPTVFGEKIVLRILDKSALNVDLTKLGLEPDDFQRFTDSIHKPFGMVLVTGPTGSGKTTTLYSALADLNKSTENIMTAEDPVEFSIDGINQVHINTQVGMSFAAALKAFLRQDPDIIMLGEIRDLETGEIAIKAALTGHLVLSTLHTNSAADTIVRLQNMGIASFNLISALNSIVAQRLAKRICESCRVEDPSVGVDHLVSLGIPPHHASQIKAYKGAGCDQCRGNGNKGRTAIHEVMTITDDLRAAIMKGEPAMVLKKIGMKNGMKTLRQNALRKLARGEVDAREVIKSTTGDSDKEGDAA